MKYLKMHWPEDVLGSAADPNFGLANVIPDISVTFSVIFFFIGWLE